MGIPNIELKELFLIEGYDQKAIPVWGLELDITSESNKNSTKFLIWRCQNCRPMIFDRLYVAENLEQAEKVRTDLVNSTIIHVSESIARNNEYVERLKSYL